LAAVFAGPVLAAARDPGPADYRVIRYDRRGYGRSDPPTKACFDIEDLHALIERLQLGKAVLVGSSSGGGLVIDYTLEHPERVEAMRAGTAFREAPSARAVTRKTCACSSITSGSSARM
jgi:pimeloyl-ACP methyl ester carboxylesterase